MEFPLPYPLGITIYTKTGCSYCTKAISFLQDLGLKFTIIDSDPYLADKDALLAFIQNLAGKEHKTFPIVFFDGKFIGGYDDLLLFLRQPTSP
jgi:glutaredoxin